MKVAEAMAFSLLSCTVFFCLVLMRQGKCRPLSLSGTEVNPQRFRCPEDQFNPMATMVFNTEAGTIRALFAFPETLKEELAQTGTGIIGITTAVPGVDIILFFLAWFVLTTLTHGVWVPGGLFMPGIMIGCSVGVIYMDVLMYGFGGNVTHIGG